MLVGSDKELDKLVRKEIKKVLLPKGWKAGFSPSKTPGRGDFCVSGVWNGAKFKYEREFEDKTYISLRKEGNEIFINIDNGGIYTIEVNDLSYTNPENSGCDVDKESWEEKTPKEIERDEALEFGINAARKIEQYLRRTAKPLIYLIDRYYSGHLKHPESRDTPRSNKEIFDKFDFSVDKP